MKMKERVNKIFQEATIGFKVAAVKIGELGR